MAYLNFNTYIVTSNDLPLREQLEFLKKLEQYEHKNDIAVQIRLNGNDESTIIEFTKELKRELNEIRLIINNSVSIMNNLDLDGVHLKENTKLENIEIKKHINNGKLILKSTHSIESIREAEAFGLSGITYGPVFDTPSKRKYGQPNGYSLLKNNDFNIPIFALGGINMDNVSELRKYFYGIAAIRLFMNKDIIKNITEVRKLWK